MARFIFSLNLVRSSISLWREQGKNCVSWVRSPRHELYGDSVIWGSLLKIIFVSGPMPLLISQVVNSVSVFSSFHYPYSSTFFVVCFFVCERGSPQMPEDLFDPYLSSHLSSYTVAWMHTGSTLLVSCKPCTDVRKLKCFTRGEGKVK